MNANRILSVIALVVASAFWIFRDAAGQGICPGLNEACVGSTQVPCTSGTGTCVATRGGNTPGGISKCGNATALYYTLQPPDTWADCLDRSNFGACTRMALYCATVYLYATQDDCDYDIPCGSNPLQGCSNNTGQGNGNQNCPT